MTALLHRALLLKLFIICTISATSQHFLLTGTVVDDEGSPLIAAIVKGHNQFLLTDESGGFEILLNTGECTFTITYTGFQEQTLKITGHAGDTLYKRITLIPKSEILNQVVVSGSRFEQSLNEVTVSMEVIRPEFIDQTNNTQLDEALDRVPGVTILDGQTSIRGGSGYSYGAGTRVLLLVEGMPALSPDAAFPSWRFIPIEHTGQVEIIKGASSVLYGSAAMNGVINFRLAYPTTETVTQIESFTGVYGNPQGNITDSLKSIDYTIINGDTTHIDSVFHRKAWWGHRQPFYSGFSVSHRQKVGNTALMAGGYLLTEESYLMNDFSRRGRLNLFLRHQHKKNPYLFYGIRTNAEVNSSASFFYWKGAGIDMYLPAANTITNNRGYQWAIDPFLEYSHGLGWKHKLQGRWLRGYNFTDAGQSVLSNMYFGEYQLQKVWDSLGVTLTGGFTGSYATVDAELYSNSRYTSTNLAGYLQLDKRFWDRLNISAGARYEWNKIDSAAESQPVVRVGANLRLAKATWVRASYGQGYRFPTIAEKYVQTNVGIIGIYPNAAITSETGWTAELGLRQGFSFGKLEGFADLAAFWQEYFNMIEFNYGTVSPGVFGFQSKNIGNTRIRGFEFTTGIKGAVWNRSFQINGGYTYLNPTFQDFDSLAQINSTADYNVLKYRFRHSLDLDASLEPCRRWTIGAGARYRSDMEAIDKVFDIFIPGIHQYRQGHATGTFVLDGRIEYDITNQAKVRLVVKNILNLEYALRPGLLEPPRTYVIQLSLKL